MKDFLGQFSKSDFFSVLPAGLYSFIILYHFFTLLFFVTSPTSPFDIFNLLADLTRQQPTYIFLILFASYLLGSIFRACPVNWAEKSVPPWNEPEFPYSDFLRKVIEEIKEFGDATKHTESKLPSWKEDKDLTNDVFNYWKDALCVNSIEGFEYYQTFETRTRFFCGMIWASWVGIGFSVGIMIASFIRSSNIVLTISLYLLIGSLFLFLAFGLNFWRVRGQEAKALLLIYSAYLQNK